MPAVERIAKIGSDELEPLPVLVTPLTGQLGSRDGTPASRRYIAFSVPTIRLPNAVDGHSCPARELGATVRPIFARFSNVRERVVIVLAVIGARVIDLDVIRTDVIGLGCPWPTIGLRT